MDRGLTVCVRMRTGNPMMPINVFIADDHAVFRSGLRALLEKEEALAIAGEAGTGAETLEQLPGLDVDILLLDIDMPGMSGSEVVRQLRTRKSAVDIIILTIHDEAVYVQELFKLNVKGYVLKKSTGTELVHAIEVVSHGESYLDPSLVNMVVSNYAGTDQPGKDDKLARLSQREQEVCRLLALGYSHARIGELLSISSRTVESHRARIMAKLDLHSRAGLVQCALDGGLLKPN